MEKKKLAAAIAACMVTLLTGCGLEGDDGKNGFNGIDGTNGTNGADGADGITKYVPEGLKRFMTAPLGAEFTGMYVNSDGMLFANIQHPSSSNDATDAVGKVFDKGTIGYVNVDVNSMGDIAALDIPITDTEKETVLTAAGSYIVLSQQGDVLDDGNNMGDILAADGSTLIKNSNDPDFNGAVSDGATGFYLYTNWEDRPGSMSRIHLDSSYTTVTQEGMLDFSGVDGTWVNCFGTVSPWGTPLSSEELYFDDTADWYALTSNPQAVAEYLGYPTDGSGNWGNPYNYGYIVEIGTGGTVDDATLSNVTVEKRELLGRFSHENGVVMPDLRTVFLSDDGTGTVLFKFVADAINDLSAGTLYAAKVTQTAGVTDPAEAAFAVEWIEIASGDEATIETAIASFDGTFAEAKYITDAQIADYAEYKSGTDLDGSGSVAANPFPGDERVGFLESRKVAAAMGATAEFRKMEGININFGLADSWWNSGAADGDQAYMYLNMSSFDKTMSDGMGDIQLDGAHGKCGAVYRMKLVKNSDGLVDITTLIPAIVGGPYYADRTTNQCNTNNISNPDNLVVLDDGRVLIGEDTGNHENNMIWLFEDPAL